MPGCTVDEPPRPRWPRRSLTLAHLLPLAALACDPRACVFCPPDLELTLAGDIEDWDGSEVSVIVREREQVIERLEFHCERRFDGRACEADRGASGTVTIDWSAGPDAVELELRDRERPFPDRAAMSVVITVEGIDGEPRVASFEVVSTDTRAERERDGDECVTLVGEGALIRP